MTISLNGSTGSSTMFRFVARPCRRVLLLLLWLCMAYGVFHWAVKDTTLGGRPSSPGGSILGGRFGVAPLTVASLYGNNLEILDVGAGGAGPIEILNNGSSSSVEMLGASSIPSRVGGVGGGSGALTVGSSTVTPRYPWLDDEPLVDKETKTVEQLILDAAATIRNIPLPPYILGGQKDGPKNYKNASCARFPTIYDIEFSNTYWQVCVKKTFWPK